MTSAVKKMNILAIGAHPDDIEIGCGGTLAKYASYGHHIYMFIATDGNAGGIGELRKVEQKKAAEILKVKKLFWGGYIDTELDIRKEAIMKVEEIIKITQPDSIFINFYDDTHQDHRHIAAITNSATRYIRNVLFYETPTTQNFQPNVFVDIGQKFLDVKMKLLKAHTSQIDRTNIVGVSILELAQSAAHFRGVQARVAYAEAFQSLRLFITIQYIMVPHYKPSFGEAEKRAVRQVLDSGYIVQGPKVRELEEILSKALGIQYGIAVSSGTTALILALKALNVSSGSEVIIPSYTCTALWHAVKAVNATPIFADIESRYWNLDPEDVYRKITGNTSAIIFPHMFGQPGRIQEVVHSGIPVIEDIAQSFGAAIQNKAAGSFGTISISSFYATKILGGGEGGMLFTNNPEIDAYLRNIRDYDEKDTLTPRVNAKMTDIHAAIALVQYHRLSEFTAKRKKILEQYQSIQRSRILIPISDINFQSNLFRCIIDHSKKNADELIQIGNESGITVRKPVFYPIHYYLKDNNLPQTESAWKKQVSIPIFPDMTAREIEKVMNFLERL